MDSCLPNFKGMREAPGLYHEIGWNVENAMLCSCSSNGEHTNSRRLTAMDKDEKLRKILGKLSGGRLEDVADKLMALFRQPEWWEEEFEKQFVARGSIGAFQDADKCDAVKAFISALLTRAQHEERQQLLLDIE